jgi:hypothetical protein
MPTDSVQEAIALLEADRARMLQRAADEPPGLARHEAFARVARLDEMLYRLRRVPPWRRPEPSSNSAAA